MTAATVAMTAAEATALASPDGQVGHSGQRGHDGVHQEPAAALEEGLDRPDPDPAEGRGQDAADTAPEAPVVEAGTGTEEDSGQEAPAPVPESVPAPYWTREGPVVQSPMPQEELAAPASSEPLAAAESEPVVREKAVPEPLSPEQKRERVRELLRSRPEITDAEIAEHIHASPRTARRYRSELTQQGSLVDTSR